MKITFNSLDIACIIHELQSLIGMRVHQIYDVDHKTYIFKLASKEEKSVVLMESGVRIHTTTFNWPKCVPPSGFTMKLRKHLKNKRIECIKQIKDDRIIDIQFGSGEASYHLILELFNKGNIILTDYMLVTLNVLRPHTEYDKFKFTVREKYPIERARVSECIPNKEKLVSIFEKAKSGEKISKILLPHLDYGAGLVDHIIISSGLSRYVKYNGKLEPYIIEVLTKNIALAEEILKQIKTQPSKGYITFCEEPRANQENLITYLEFNPYLFIQNVSDKYNEFNDFNSAVDEYFSKTEGQKIELRALQMEKDAFQKVEKIVELQKQRVENLITSQEDNRKKAELIIANSNLIDETILVLRLVIAKQISWPDIAAYFKELARLNNPIGLILNELKLEINHVSLSLSDPYNENKLETTTVDIDLGLSAFANASRYYDNKKTAAIKQIRTLESQDKAVKSATKKAKETLKDIQSNTAITKARKVLWFEKFYWFISSDNYLIIGGRDQQQNEFVVKKYMNKDDLYVHADIHGSSSIIIKNPKGEVVPPRTLNEAGNMAVCYSVGWDAKVMCSAWWVHAEQVTKTAPSGEYLTTGSFVIRGQKNYLLPAQLALGFGFIFRLEESSVFRHEGERKARTVNDLDELQISNPVRESKEDSIKEVDIISKNIKDGLHIGNGSSDIGKSENYRELIDLSEGVINPSMGLFTSLQNLISPSQELALSLEDMQSVGLIHLKKITPSLELLPTEEIMGSSPNNDAQNFDESSVLDDIDKSVSDIATSYSNPTTTDKGVNKQNMKRVMFLEKEKQQLEKEKLFLEMEKRQLEIAKDHLEKEKDFNDKQKQQTVKRGQKSKLKKIREKYKDQDEEEKQLRMAILQSAGTKKEPKKIKKQGKSTLSPLKKTNNENPKNFTHPVAEIVSEPVSRISVTPNDEDEELEDQPTVDVDIINLMTGNPHVEDELLFAIPVVAPYSTLINYKYKVKMTPGTGKRSRCSKMAIESFLKQKDCHLQEKLLIKNVNDQTLYRNFPGKVKISFAAQKKH